ncbi:DUF2889 domain-containing protein [Cupriavidus sp. CP313]
MAASEVKARLGGVHGCTHLTELIGVLATTAMQTIFALLRTERGGRLSADEQGPMPMPTLVNSCHTHRIDGEAIRVLWPEPRRAVARKPSRPGPAGRWRIFQRPDNGAGPDKPPRCPALLRTGIPCCRAHRCARRR